MAHVLAKDLRAAVLQAGIQGKLTNQLNSDTSVKESLLDISTEKKKQIKEKLMKNEKLPSEIKESEITLAIPESWQFVRLGDVVKLLSGQDLTPDRYSDKPNGIPYITGSSNFYVGSIVINRYTLSPTSVALKGDLLITCKGTVGELAYLKVEKAHIARQIMSISTIGNLNLQYVELLLRNFIETLKAKAKSIIPGIDRKTILNLVVPFPPIEEQQRIVDRVDELMTKIDEYEKLENQLVQLKEQFPKDMRDSLLQAGMMGKLTKQLTTDSDINDLYDDLKKQREVEIKAKLTKTKFPNVISIEDYPYDIPDNWKFARYETIGYFGAGKTPKNEFLSSNGTTPYFKVSDMNTVGNEVFMKVANNYLKNEYTGNIFMKGSFIFPKNGGAVFTNKKRILDSNALVDLNTGVYTASSKMCLKFVFYLFNRLDFRFLYKGTALPTVDMDKVRQILIPLPPIEEQQRIVDKLDEMLPLVDALAQMD